MCFVKTVLSRQHCRSPFFMGPRQSCYSSAGAPPYNYITGGAQGRRNKQIFLKALQLPRRGKKLFLAERRFLPMRTRYFPQIATVRTLPCALFFRGIRILGQYSGKSRHHPTCPPYFIRGILFGKRNSWISAVATGEYESSMIRFLNTYSILMPAIRNSPG